MYHCASYLLMYSGVGDKKNKLPICFVFTNNYFLLAINSQLLCIRLNPSRNTRYILHYKFPLKLTKKTEYIDSSLDSPNPEGNFLLLT